MNAVLNLKTILYGKTSINVSWTAPWSLDVTGVDPDIWYSVIIYNVTDMNNISTIQYNDINETRLLFSPDYIGFCHGYHFSVVPVNGAGEGERSQNVTGYLINSKWFNSKARAINTVSCDCIETLKIVFLCLKSAKCIFFSASAVPMPYIEAISNSTCKVTFVLVRKYSNYNSIVNYYSNRESIAMAVC